MGNYQSGISSSEFRQTLSKTHQMYMKHLEAIQRAHNAALTAVVNEFIQFLTTVVFFIVGLFVLFKICGFIQEFLKNRQENKMKMVLLQEFLNRNAQTNQNLIDRRQLEEYMLLQAVLKNDLKMNNLKEMVEIKEKLRICGPA